LQNHGVFVGAACVDEIKEIYRDIMGRLEKRIKRQPDFSTDSSEGSRYTPWEYLSAISSITGDKVAFICNNEISALIKNREAFYPVSSAFTPDHIVYAGSDPLFTDAGTEVAGREAWKNHIDKFGKPPKIAALRGMGVFGLGPTEKAATLALELFVDAVKVAVYSESFGGPLFMSQDKIDFINNWEVEQFRTSVAIKQ
jgi:rhamnose utilization protein RhaD (predicted bifunctional aldolase and dehydrogenase)